MTCSSDYPRSGLIQIPVSLSGDIRPVQCLIHGMRDRKLLLEVDEKLPLRIAVSVEVDDSIFLGEVITCVSAQGRWNVELKVEQILNGLQSLMALRDQLSDHAVTSPFSLVPAGVRN